MSNENQEEPIVIKRNRPVGEDRVQVKLHKVQEDRRYYSQDQVSIDKIVEDSESNFYITGKNVKLSFLDLLNLVEKHNINQVANLDEEEIIVSSKLVTQIATADITDEDEDKLKLIDATAVGLFMGSLLLSVFALFTKTMADIKTFSWVILGVSAFFLTHYLYRGYKSGEIRNLSKAWMRKLGKDA
jgi:hypothetical protein